jgi:hypothetical protein
VSYSKILILGFWNPVVQLILEAVWIDVYTVSGKIVTTYVSYLNLISAVEKEEEEV